MTTALTEGKWILEYKNRSSRQLYFEQCMELDIPVNAYLYSTLCEDIGDFTAYTVEVPETQYIGPKAVRALLPVLKVNQIITKLCIPGQGANDDVINEMMPMLKQHERLHVIDVSNNPDITDASADILAMLIKVNTAVTDVFVHGTSLSPMVQRTLKRFALKNKTAVTIFLTGDYVPYKMLFEKLDIDQSGAISMFDVLQHVDNHEIFEAVEKRFQVMDTSGDSKLQIDEFLSFLHPNFFPMKERIIAFLKTPDPSEDNVVANWAMMKEAARIALVACPSFHLGRVYHKQISLEEATNLIREAVVHEHQRKGNSPDSTSLVPPVPELCRGEMFVDQLAAQSQAGDRRSQAMLDMYTPVQARSMFYAVRNLFEKDEAEYWLKCQHQWSKVYNVRICPALARHCHAVFMELVNRDVELARSRFRDVHATEVAVEALLSTPIKSKIWTLNGVALRKSLETGLDLTLSITFAEWFTILNDRYDIAFGMATDDFVMPSPVAAPRK